MMVTETEKAVPREVLSMVQKKALIIDPPNKTRRYESNVILGKLGMRCSPFFVASVLVLIESVS